MAVPSGARPSPALAGDLQRRPLALLLAGAGERGASGTFTFRHGARQDVLTMRAGAIAVVRTSDPIAFLGGVLYELGLIDITTLNETLREVASHKRLHGSVLLERGHITRAELEHGLIEQTFRKVHHLFSLPEETTWSFCAEDDLEGARDEDRPSIAYWPAIWRGLRDQPASSHMRSSLAKIDGGLYLRDLASVARFDLAPEEHEICERLAAQPMTLARVVATSHLAAERTRRLVYLLGLSRSLVRVDAKPVGPAALGVEGVRERARRLESEDPYAVLGLRTGASVEAARAAYFRLARLWYPARIPAELAEVRSECEHIFERLGEAHRFLTEPGARRAPGAPASEGATAASVPAVTRMRDVDAALARNDLEVADALARTLANAGSEGPSARAVIAWCDAGAGASRSTESLERALAALARIITGDPDCVRALYYHGELLKRLGRTEGAQRDFRKVVRLDPRHLDAQRELRLHEMRRRPSSVKMRAAQVTRPSSLANLGTSSARAANANAEVEAPVAEPREATPAAAAHESRSLASGLRRLLARAAGK